jgi:hypothetical protein
VPRTRNRKYENIVELLKPLPPWAKRTFLNEKPKKPVWLQRAYKIGADQEQPGLARAAMKYINNYFYDGRFFEIDELLQDIDEKRVPLVVLISLVRFCSAAHGRLDHLAVFRNRVLAEIRRRGKQDQTLLR